MPHRSFSRAVIYASRNILDIRKVAKRDEAAVDFVLCAFHVSSHVEGQREAADDDLVGIAEPGQLRVSNQGCARL